MAATDDPTPEQIAHVATAVQARMAQLGMVYSNVADKGPSRDTTRALIVDHKWIRRRDVRAKLALALRWQADGIDRLAAGLEPEEIDTGPTPGEEISRLAEIQAGQSEEIRLLRGQQAAFELEFRGRLAGLENLLRQIAHAVEGQRGQRRRGGSPPQGPPAS